MLACDVDTVQRLLTAGAAPARRRPVAARRARRRPAVLSDVALINCVSVQGTRHADCGARHCQRNESHADSLFDAVRTIALLVQNRCDVNGCTEIGWTLLHKDDAKPELPENDTLPHQCELCDWRFPNLNFLAYHIKAKHC